MAERTGKPSPEKDAKGRFIAGNSGNGGRPKGSRNRLGEEFIQAVYADFMDHGAAAVRHVRENDPSTYIRVIAGILPKEMNINTTSALSDAELDARIRELLVLTGMDGGVGRPAGGATQPNGSGRSH